MRIEELKRRKQELGLTAEMIASASGIPLGTVQKVFSGATKTPRKATVDAILRVLEQEEDRVEKHRMKRAGSRNHLSCGTSEMPQNVLREPPVQYHAGKEAGYTTKDYYALPDERRVELIDGSFYDMAAPTIVHQKILGELYILFRECMDRHDGKCEVFLSPCDVRLNRDEYTMVQPDLFVICREYDMGGIAFEGAPDLTLEVLSPSTRSKDMLLKLYKYAGAGVKEYWIVDPEKRAVLVYDLQHEDYYPSKYGFEDTIPIRLSGGTCNIDFSRVLEKIGYHSNP